MKGVEYHCICTYVLETQFRWFIICYCFLWGSSSSNNWVGERHRGKGKFRLAPSDRREDFYNSFAIFLPWDLCNIPLGCINSCGTYNSDKIWKYGGKSQRCTSVNRYGFTKRFFVTVWVSSISLIIIFWIKHSFLISTSVTACIRLPVGRRTRRII